VKILHGITRIGGAGTERQLRNLICGSSGPDFDHSVFTFESGNFEADLVRSRCSIYVRPLSRRKLPLALHAIVGIIHKERPHIIQSWDPAYDVLFALAALRTRVPFIASERNSALQYVITEGYGKAWFRYIIGPLLRASASLIIANSRSGLHYVQKITRNSVRGVHVRNGIDMREIERVASLPVSIPDNIGPFMIVANRLNGPKRTQQALEAFNLVAQQVKNLSLVVLGKGPEEEALKGYANTLSGAERIHFLGHVENLPAYMRASAGLLSASAVEGMPNSVIEAMALGTPAILTDIDAHRELWEDSEGGVMLYGRESVLEGAQAMKTMLRKSAERDTMISNAKRYATGLTMERSAGEIIRCYEEVAT
jgi:glycosyltransferase involved in cell wall biosynthesis